MKRLLALLALFASPAFAVGTWVPNGPVGGLPVYRGALNTSFTVNWDQSATPVLPDYYQIDLVRVPWFTNAEFGAPIIVYNDFPETTGATRTVLPNGDVRFSVPISRNTVGHFYIQLQGCNWAGECFLQFSLGTSMNLDINGTPASGFSVEITP